MTPSVKDIQLALEKHHGIEFQRKISSATVAICGLGGLGSNIAMLLARAGIGKIILIDFDKVDVSNLNRQQYKVNQVGQYKAEALAKNIKEIMPCIQLEIHVEKLSDLNIIQLLHQADIVCEALDQAQTKAWLVNTVLEKMPNKYVVAASGMAGFNNPNTIQTKVITDHFYLCGDRSSDLGLGLISSRVMICAAHQAHAVLHILQTQDHL